jgi:uroporphyrinogen decarboxylase
MNWDQSEEGSKGESRMTPKERVLAAIDHVQPDRPPIQVYTTPEIDQRLRDCFGARDYIEEFEVDFRTVWIRDLNETRRPEPGSGIDRYDIWGTGYKDVTNAVGGTYSEAWDRPLARLKTMDEVEAYPWPDVENCNVSMIAEQIDAVKDYAVIFGWVGVADIINSTSFARGMEQVLIDIITEDEAGVSIIDRRVDYYYECVRRGLEAGNGKIDILHLGEDLGTQKGPTISPETFERFFRPRYQRYFDLAHHYGARVMLHSCGSTRMLQSRLIDIGLDVLDSVQPEPVGMDPEELKREFGERLTYCGMISTQHTLPHGTVEECRAEARHRIDVIGKGGGYIFAPAHCIQPDTPLENILAIYEEATGKRFARPQ